MALLKQFVSHSAGTFLPGSRYVSYHPGEISEAEDDGDSLSKSEEDTQGGIPQTSGQQ